MTKIYSEREILTDALDTYSPIGALLLFSGGHDSLVSTHLMAGILSEEGVPFTVYHGDTTIGIPETQEFVRQVCSLFGWPLVIRQPPEKDHYEKLVADYGFSGPTKESHQFTFRRFKERALRGYVSNEYKSSVYAREHVLLISGARKSESTIRMGYTNPVHKDDSRIWCNPIFWWSNKKCQDYIAKYNLPKNPVKEKLCISGECLCGCFARPEERAEIKVACPHVDRRLSELEDIAKANGHPWPWGTGPTQWFKNRPPGVIDMFTGEPNPGPMFMCVNCKK